MEKDLLYIASLALELGALLVIAGTCISMLSGKNASEIKRKADKDRLEAIRKLAKGVNLDIKA